MGEHHCSFDALTPTKGTAQVVRLFRSLGIEECGKFFAGEHAGVKSSIVNRISIINVRD